MTIQVAGYVVTASDWNEVANNFPQTFPGLITTDGDMVVATAANAGKRVAMVDSNDRLLQARGGTEADLSAITTGGGIVGQSISVYGVELAMTQAEAEAGTDTQVRAGITAERINQALVALSLDITQSQLTAGSSSQESVTWDTAFGSTPVVVSSADGASAADGSTEFFTVLEARSTTGATGDSTRMQLGDQAAAVKTFMARLTSGGP